MRQNRPEIGCRTRPVALSGATRARKRFMVPRYGLFGYLWGRCWESSGECRIKGILDVIRAGLGALKDAKDIAGSGPAAEEIGRRIEDAERTIATAEAQFAKALGYQLCRRHWPPAIMLAAGEDPRTFAERWKCPDCGEQRPSEAELTRRAQHAEAGANRRSLRARSSWLDR